MFGWLSRHHTLLFEQLVKRCMRTPVTVGNASKHISDTRNQNAIATAIRKSLDQLIHVVDSLLDVVSVRFQVPIDKSTHPPQLSTDHTALHVLRVIKIGPPC